jgi:hypothetical protein
MALWSTLFGTNRGLGNVTAIETTKEVRYGFVPIGTVIPMMSSTVGAYSHPGGGIVDRGLMLCDGVTVIPSGPMAGQMVPGLDSAQYLRGSATSGIPGGANNKGIPVTILPPHTHAAALAPSTANHAHAGAPNGSATADHLHRQYVTANSGPVGARDWDSDGSSAIFNQGTGTAFDNSYHPHPTGSVSTGNAPHPHPLTFNPAGAGGNFNVEPSYIDVVYAIRVE